MRTEITLEEPYSKDWRKGYLVTNKENRKTVILYNSNKDRSSTQYARYLLAVKLGRYLTEEETVDHIDNDKTNDNLNNLQLLSREENRKKQASFIRDNIEHGTYSCYKVLGCRCEACILACKEYMRPFRKKWLAEHRDEYNARRREKRARAKVEKEVNN